MLILPVFSQRILFTHPFVHVMPSYMTLTVLALAASTVSPALSAPVRYGNRHF